MSEFAQLFEKVTKIQGISEGLRQEGVQSILSTAMVDAIRGKDFSFPYQEETKSQVLKMKDDIEKAAQTMGLSPLAVAGAFADLLEVDTTFDTKKFHDTLGELIWQAASEAIKKGDEELGALIDAAQNLPQPASVFATWGNLVWNLLPRDYKGYIAGYLSKQLYELLSWFFRECHIAATANRDDFAGMQAKEDITELAKTVKLLPEKVAKLKSDIKALAIKEMTVRTFFVFRLYFYISEDERLINKAKKIASRLSEVDDKPEQRLRIYKWERFYNLFN